MKLKRIMALLMVATVVFSGCAGKPKVNIGSVDDLKEKKIGVQDGTTGASYAGKVEGAKVSGFKSGMDAALDLMNGTIDCVILDELPAKSIVNKNKGKLKILDMKLTSEDYAIAVKKGNKDLIKSINATIARMKKDGTYDKLTDAFMGTEAKVPDMPKATGDMTLKMGTNAQFAPFEYTENGEIVGFDVSMANEIAKDMKASLKVEDMNFDSLITAVASGMVDMVIAGMTVEPDRLESVDFSDPYFTSTQVVIVRE